MKKFLNRLQELLDRHGTLVVATIVRTTGSTPRKAGARMIILPDGTTWETLGGGAFEAQVTADGRRAFREGGNTMKHYEFCPADEGGMGALCGGSAEVFFDVCETEAKLVVYGAGHCGRALVRMAAPIGFACTAVDHRQECLAALKEENPAFPVETILTPPEYTLHPPVDERTHLVIMTSSHDDDERVLRQVLRAKTAYLGMIASRAKMCSIRERLLADGFTEAEIGRVHAPVGLPIGAETPGEIAVSILAEIIAVRRGAPAGRWD